MKVLIIGLGSIAKKHIKALRDISNNIEILALRRENSSFIPFEGVKDIFELASEQLFDFIIISNPTSEHAITISKFSKLNIPLFIEKPIFNSLKYDRLVNEVTRAQIPTYVACNLRFLDCINYLKNKIKEKSINEINVYCGSYLPDWRPGIDFRTVYSANKELGGGVHIDLIHEIDYLVYLFGYPDRTRKTFKSNSTLNISSYDYSNYLLEYKDFCANIILNYYRKTAKRMIELVCDDGEFEVDLLNNTVLWNQELVFESEQRIKDTYLPQMQYFINNVLKNNENEHFNDISEAYKILKICMED